MKGLIIGLIIGVAGTWYWYHTDKGKISITETTTVTNIVTEAVEKTWYVDKVRWITRYKTNVVWETNIVEKMVGVAPKPVTRAAIKYPKAIEPVVEQEVPVEDEKKHIGLGGPRPAPGGVRVTKYHRRTGEKTVVEPIKETGAMIRRNMDGSIKE